MFSHRSRRRAQIRRSLIILLLLSGALSTRPANAATPLLADSDLTVAIDSSGTGSLVNTVRTPTLRDAAPSSAARLLVIGTGIQRSLFPTALQNSIASTTAADLTDAHGYGTIAASTIFQLLPSAQLTSLKVRAFDSTWTLLDMQALARALDYARSNRDRFDAVLLAFPPNAALDPIPDIEGHLSYGKFGRGLAMLQEAILATESNTDGPVAGIPTDAALRNRIFAGANLRQRDAVERYVTAALNWRAVTRSLADLDGAGVAVIAPSGDFTQRSGGQIVPLVTQTVFGVSALPSVITVGASYGSDARLSPTSGRGPTLDLAVKPDLVAPSDVMAMLPANARLAWPDDSARVPLQTLAWARPNVTPSTCPSVTGDYRCVLQGSTMVSASVVAANIAGLVATSLPHTASARAASDDEVLRGIVWARASKSHARTADGARTAAWDEGAGVLTGLAGLDLTKTPVLLERADLGQVAWGDQRSGSFDVWDGGAPVLAADARPASYIGPNTSGAAVIAAVTDPSRFAANAEAGSVTATASEARYQGGVYTGTLALSTPDGAVTNLPLSVIQDVTLDFHVDYAYNEFTGNGAEGERVEDQTVVLFPGLPTGVGLIGEAFKSLTARAFKPAGGDPMNGMTLRYGTTKSQFSDPNLPASEHGRAQIKAVPPGFYRIHLLTDAAVEAQQARGRAESLGIGLGSSGPDAAFSPASNLLVAQPPCATAGVRGPLSGCPSRSSTSDIDPATGLCVARNSNTQVAFNVYCGEIAFAMPGAVVSRAIHLIEHAADASASEWRTCGINVPTDASALDLAKIVEQAKSCPGQTAPTAWTFGTRAPDCLGTSERAANASGIPTDVNATFAGVSAPSTPGRNFPVGVLTYEFALPSLNTYTTAGLSLAYKTENAIVAVRFRTGTAATDDAANGLVVAHASNVNVAPALPRTSGARGSVYNEYAVMSANASVGQVSIIVIPTAWSRADLDPTKPIARVQLCDIALRVDTFAKQAWSKASGTPATQWGSMRDRGLIDQIDPSVERVRAVWNGSGFTDAGREGESLRFATLVPKNSTADRTQPHHVRSPRGGPAYLSQARRIASDTSTAESVLPTGYKQYDMRRGVTRTICHEGSVSPAGDPVVEAMWETCRRWDDAREGNDLLAEIAPDTMINGRFSGVFALDEASLRDAVGDVAFAIADADDRGAADAAGHWARRDGELVTRLPVSDFYNDAQSPFSLSLLSGTVTLGKDSAGAPLLAVRTASAGGDTHTITIVLH